MNKTILIVAAVVVIAAVAIWFTYQKGMDKNEPITGNEVTFTDPGSGDFVSVVFTDDDRAVLNGLGYDGVELRSAIAASGARYVNEELDLELWNRGDSVTISKSGQQVFAGNQGGLTDSDRLDEDVFVWQATTINDEVIEPVKKDAFTIDFDGDRVSGTTDCNGFSGSYEVGENNTLSFGPLAMTKMFCEGSQEAEFVAPLADVRSFFFAGSGALVLELEGGGTMLFGKQ